jgi:FkbM family methyltransferase
MKKLFKILYQILPLKKQIFSLIKKFWTPPESIYKHLHFKGDFNVRIKEKASIRLRHFGYQLENDIFWSGLFGNWEKYSIDTWIKLSERSAVIFDIGANTGIYSLIAKAVNDESKVYAFEPVARVYDKLLTNNSLNRFDIQSFMMAVSNNTGKELIYDEDSEHEYTASLQQSKNNFKNSTEVNTVTLDDFVKQHAIEKIDLMKIDVELHEPAVMEGFKMIRKFMPTIIIEILNDEIGKKVEACLEGLNYNFYSIDEKKGFSKVDRISKGFGYNYLICEPEIARFLKL